MSTNKSFILILERDAGNLAIDLQTARGDAAAMSPIEYFHVALSMLEAAAQEDGAGCCAACRHVAGAAAAIVPQMMRSLRFECH